MASTDLLISQWANADRLQHVLQIYLDTSEQEIDKAVNDITDMLNIDKALGVWLDRIGIRVGIRRPYSTDPSSDERWGFDGVAQARGFDQAPFKGAPVNDAVFPLPDVVFRRVVKSRIIAILTDGTLSAFRQAALTLDSGASVVDNRDMSIVVTTAQPWVFRLADSIHALPRVAGVLINYRDRERFGYDDAGQPFDQGYFTGVGAVDAGPT